MYLIDFVAREKKKKLTATNYESAFKAIFHFEHAISRYYIPIADTKETAPAQCIYAYIVIDVILIELFGLCNSTGFAGKALVNVNVNINIPLPSTTHTYTDIYTSVWCIVFQQHPFNFPNQSK